MGSQLMGAALDIEGKAIGVGCKLVFASRKGNHGVLVVGTVTAIIDVDNTMVTIRTASGRETWRWASEVSVRSEGAGL